MPRRPNLAGNHIWPPWICRPATSKDGDAITTTAGALPVRVVLCVRCHYLEMYHDVGLGKLG